MLEVLVLTLGSLMLPVDGASLALPLEHISKANSLTSSLLFTLPLLVSIIFLYNLNLVVRIVLAEDDTLRVRVLELDRQFGSALGGRVDHAAGDVVRRQLVISLDHVLLIRRFALKESHFTNIIQMYKFYQISSDYY